MVASTKADKVKPPVFHEVELARGWRILQEHVALRVDLVSRSVSGLATFHLCALNHQFVNVALNLRRCRVDACKINGQPAPFRLVSPLDDDELLEAVSSDRARHRIANIEYSMSTREDAANMQGELVVDLPVSISADVIDELDEAFKKCSKPDGRTEEEEEEPLPDAVPPVALDGLPLVTLTVEYHVLDPTAGAVHYGDISAPKPLLDPVYMLTDGRYGMARCWMPCVDSMLWCDRYLFDFDVTVKSNLVVVASGELIETRLIEPDEASMTDDSDELKTFKYRLHAPSHASEIMLAVGPFIPLPDPSLPNTVTHFCLPGRVHELVHTGPPLLAKALAFCRDYFGADPPCSSFKLLFVGSLGLRSDSTIAGAGGIVVHSGDFLHTPRCIDEGLASREAIMNGLVTSYFGRFLRPRSAEDDWLIAGLAAHVGALGLQAMLGRNWYRFRILDLMDELRLETSCDLSDIKMNRVTDATVDSVRRRSHIIVYMIERRIGNDVMKRALRDIVAEGRSVTMTTLGILETALSKSRTTSSQGGEIGKSVSPPPEPTRVLKDLNGESHGQNSGGGVVSSGFDEALQGVSVGPFLKRLRAICGTDLRSLVRLWAASPGIPRMQIGYQYNPRRHTVEFVVKQEAVENGSLFGGRRGLPFTGTINVRVMEIEGASDHSVEIRDLIFVTELPCHSRRAKHKSAAQAEKEFNENPARASPVLWLRVDPELEWCKDAHFKQSEDSWMALLKGERDALGQFEACRGLAESGSEMAAKALLSILEDDQIYWRVRAECAKVLAECIGGLPMLLKYFRSCYTDNAESDTGTVRLNNFTNFANYFVKRAMVTAVVGARVAGSRTVERADGSIPCEATKFISFVLAGNDNAGNNFDDDYYVIDLLRSAAELAVRCVDDENHISAGEGGIPTTNAIEKQLERYRSIEQLIPSRSGLTVSATTKALADIELAKMVSSDAKERGAMAKSIMLGQFSANSVLVRLIHELSDRQCTLDARICAMTCLAQAYGGDLEATLWLLARVDSSSSGQDIQDSVAEARKRKAYVSDRGFIESATLRYKLLDALAASASSKKWYGRSSPLLLALRRHTKRAIQVCIRVMRLCVADSDPRVRASAIHFAKVTWGKGVPVCLLTQGAYLEARRSSRRVREEVIVDIVDLKTNGSIRAPQVAAAPAKPAKQGKPGRPSRPAKDQDVAKADKSTKPAKATKKRFTIPRSQVDTLSLPNGTRNVKDTLIDVDEQEHHKNKDESPYLEISPPVEVAKPPAIQLEKNNPVPKIQLPRSVPKSVARSPAMRDVDFPWHPLDKEDADFLRRAWEQEESRKLHNRKEKHRESPVRAAHSSVADVTKDDFQPLAVDTSSEHKKKKKKKKKKRLSEGEDGHRKKKKKKKKREEGHNYDIEPSFDDGFGDFDGSLADGGSANVERKIGKFKIKLPSAAPAPARAP